MRSDDTLATLARENPIDEHALPAADSASALALEERVLARDTPARGVEGTRRPGRASAATGSGRWRASGVRIAVVGGLAAAVAVGALSVLPGDPERSLVGQASAADGAIAALAGTPDATVHLELTVRVTNADGTAAGWRTESWQETSPPYDRREQRIYADGTRIEAATVDNTLQSYDAATNTITIHELPADGTHAQPGSTPPPATGQPFRDQVLSLLRAGKLRESGRTRVQGRDAITFSWNDGHTTSTYAVAAGTYDPIRWHLRSDDGTATTVTFRTYELLRAKDAPLDLTTQHPNATVTREPRE